MSNLLRSLVLTTFFSFTAPILLLCALLWGLWLLSWVPWLTSLGEMGVSQLLQILTVFGAGSPWPGLLVIGATCSLVGGFFDLFNFCLYQDGRGE
ncbi:MAG: hypothetical protein VKN60_10805 [Cyanobacteriota bacterium]|nr:hypothetical protein [Cyanobacteriota bacterium]